MLFSHSGRLVKIFMSLPLSYLEEMDIFQRFPSQNSKLIEKCRCSKWFGWWWEHLLQSATWASSQDPLSYRDLCGMVHFSNQVRGIFSSFGLLSSLTRLHPSSALLGHQVHTIVLLFLHLEIYFPLNRDLQKCTSLWLFIMTATPGWL